MNRITTALIFFCALHVYGESSVTLQIEPDDTGIAYTGKVNSAGAFFWSDGLEPHKGADYFVPAKRNLRINWQEAGSPFAGDSLTVAGTIALGGGWDKHFHIGKPVSFEAGSRLVFYSYHYGFTATPITSRGTAQAPVSFVFAAVGTDKDYYFPSEFMSEAGSETVFSAGNDPVAYAKVRARLQEADFSGFYGTLRVVNGVHAYSTQALAVPGTLEIGTNGLLSVTASTGESSFGGLIFRKGSRLILSKDNTHLIKISGRLEIEDGVKFDLWKTTSFNDGTPPVYPVFELTAEAAEASGDLDALLEGVEISTSEATSLPAWRWTVADGEDGGKTIGVTHRKIVQMKNNFGYGNDAFNLSKGDQECSHWTDSRYPHENADYYLYTYNALAYCSDSPSKYVFPGNTLVVNSHFGLYSNCKDFEANFVFMGSTCHFRAMTSGAKYHLRGKIRISPYSKKSQGETFLGETAAAYNFTIAQRGTLTLDADISGSGIIAFGMSGENVSPVKLDTVGTVVLNGDNSAFDGKMTVSCWQTDTLPGEFANAFADAPFVPGPVSNLTLRVAGSSSLGGPRAEFAHDALTLSNECRLAFSESAVFAEPTRGWYFPEAAYLDVPADCTVKVMQALKFGADAVVFKEGDGRLVLGGAVSADEGGEARPELKVLSGELGFASADAFEGLEVAFADGASLVATADADAGLKAGGLAVDAATFGGAGTIPVTLDFGDSPVTEKKDRIALFTAPDADTAAMLLARLDVARVQGCHLDIETVTNADGSVTVIAAAGPKGLVVTVR